MLAAFRQTATAEVVGLLGLVLIALDGHHTRRILLADDGEFDAAQRGS